MALAPVILFVYKRAAHTLQTLQALQKNELADQTNLIIYCDGPKENADSASLQEIEEVRRIAKSEQWCNTVEVIERKENLGLARNVIRGVSETIEEYGSAIILEDDLITSPYFLRFMNDALNKYKEDERVISIHAYVYPVKEKLPETFFLRGADCWGWATWKRGWELLDIKGKGHLKKIDEENLRHSFNFNGSYPYRKMLYNQVEGKISSWAILWYASAFLKNKLTLYPGTSLVRNIGTDGLGTHVRKTGDFEVKLADRPIEVRDIPVEVNGMAYNSFVKYFRSIRFAPLHNTIDWFREQLE